MLQFDDQSSGRRPMQQAVEIRARATDAATHRNRQALRGRTKVRQNSKQQIAIKLGERHSDDPLEIEKFRGIGAGLYHAMVGLADDQ